MAPQHVKTAFLPQDRLFEILALVLDVGILFGHSKIRDTIYAHALDIERPPLFIPSGAGGPPLQIQSCAAAKIGHDAHALHEIIIFIQRLQGVQAVLVAEFG